VANASSDKVFIFNHFECSPTDGGPSGVLGQCLCGREGTFYHVNPVHVLDLRPLDRLRKIRLAARLPGFFLDWQLHCEQIFKRFQVAGYPVIYYHDIYSLAFTLHLIGRDQTVVLQSHSPELPHEEFAQLPHASGELVQWVADAERQAFLRADCLVFPNDGVLDIYAPLIADSSRICYLETGARQPSQLQSIPLDRRQIHLLYIGRRNAIKGFDIILQAFQEAHQKHPELSLVLVGSGASVNSEGVVDVGFSHKPQDWINSCDFVINCNRQSYFDLSAIETLSVGTPLIISENFGHRAFASLGGEGIMPIGSPSVDNLRAVLDPAYLRPFMIPSARDANRKLYQERFSDSVYRAHLELLCRGLLERHRKGGRFSHAGTIPGCA
jgi:glycosyltransferase involved in cell wall biosynthesis